MTLAALPRPANDQLADALQLVILLRAGLREDHRLLDLASEPVGGNPFTLAYLAAGNYYRLGRVPEGRSRHGGRRPGGVRRPVSLTAPDLRSERFAGRLDFVVDGSVIARPDLADLTALVAGALAPEGVWLGAIARGEPQRHALTWAAGEHGLRITFVAGPSAAAQRWFLASRLPAPARGVCDLGLSSWMSLLAEQALPADNILGTRCGMI
ncbi:hypothetical protein [Micromonospora sp. CA-246542]|uniref:hypothetical protein n=1 Tax=Micromonospora sp. CA-246542 TaxID=3239959 RepID=UPI003D89BD0B